MDEQFDALSLSFAPDAIREHYEGEYPNPSEHLTDAELARIGADAMLDDELWTAFHNALERAFHPGRCESSCNADISEYAPGLTLCAVCEEEDEHE